MSSSMPDTLAQFLASNLSEFIRTGVILVALWVAYVATARYGYRGIARITTKGGDDIARADTLWAMIRRILILAVGVTGLLMVASTWNIPITPLVAVGSAVGVALGFGAQDLVKDVISGFFILAEDQYRVGDVIQIAGVAGVVEDIRPRVTVLRDLDGNVHYVQNGEITVSTNYTQEFAYVVVDVGIAYKEDVNHGLEVLGDELERFAADPEWADQVFDPPEILGVERLDDSAVVLRGRVKVTATDRWKIRRELLRRVKNRLDAEGIEIPFPHLTLYRGED